MMFNIGDSLGIISAYEIVQVFIVKSKLHPLKAERPRPIGRGLLFIRFSSLTEVL